MTETKCPCGSGREFADCCGPILNGSRTAVTAADLMRARYTAYTTAGVDFLRESSAPALKRKFDEKSTREWAQGSEWRGLQILRCDKGGAADPTGSVEFIASYRYKEQDQEHHETATFVRDEQGRWLFEDGVVAGHDPIRRTEPKIGRNDPCPCGSGLKFKKCCALKSSAEEVPAS
jgi:SEC-C motif-containing protein